MSPTDIATYQSRIRRTRAALIEELDAMTAEAFDEYRAQGDNLLADLIEFGRPSQRQQAGLPPEAA